MLGHLIPAGDAVRAAVLVVEGTRDHGSALRALEALEARSELCVHGCCPMAYVRVILLAECAHQLARGDGLPTATARSAELSVIVLITVGLAVLVRMVSRDH